MTLKKEAMMEELVSRSHKQVKKQIDHRLAAKDGVKMVPTRADTKKTKDEVGMMTSQL